MTNPLGVDDFFVLEAGEYLERLTALVGGMVAPTADELVRYTRALRGSALMANQTAIARAAGGLESLARSLRDGRSSWEAGLGQLAVRAVGQIRQMVSRVGHWTDADSTAAERLANELESVARGAAPPPPPTREAAGPDTGVRAFVAREGAMVASALDQAAHALRTSPTFADALQAVSKRMQPLRGLAALTDFPPIPDLLEGVERAAADLGHGATRPEVVGRVFEAAAKALSRAARDVAQNGRPAPDAEEARHFADLLMQTDAESESVVPVESLFFDDGRPGIVQRGTAPRPAPPSPLGQAELVSRGEHLCQVADDLDRATSPTQRDLRLHALATDLRSLGEAVVGELGARVRGFGDQARDSITRGHAARAAREFAGRLREAGQLLRSWSDQANEGVLIDHFTALTKSIASLGAVPAPPPAAPPAEPEIEIVPIESLLMAEPGPEPEVAILTMESTVDIVEILVTSPAPEPAPPAAVLVAAGEGAPGETPDLVGSFVTYARLVRERGLGPASLTELLRAPTTPPPARAPAPVAAPTPVPAPAPVGAAPAAAPPPRAPRASPVTAGIAADRDVVEIATLCYRGRSALQRAADIKAKLRAALAERAPAHTVDPLLDELMDLVELALVEE